MVMASLDWFVTDIHWRRGVSVSPTTTFLTMSVYTYTEWFLKLTSVTSAGLVCLPRFTFPFSPSWNDQHGVVRKQYGGLHSDSVLGEYVLLSLSSLFFSLSLQFCQHKRELYCTS